MARFVVAVSLCLLVTSFALAQSDPQALAYAAKSMAAITGGNPISDAALTGTATWFAGSDTETGTVLLKASGTGESRMDLALGNGNRSEIRDASTGAALGQWIAPDNSSGLFAFQNCFTDAVWFFPVLSSLSAGPNVVLTYIGQETRNGQTVQHLRTYVSQGDPLPPPLPTAQQLSTMDFYLDAVAFLPSAILFNSHPDNDPGTNISIEVDFSNYQALGGAMVPLHVQKYLQGTLALDLSLSSAAFNTGLSLSNFTISQ